MHYKVVELMLLRTCNYRCGYCGFALDGSVRNVEDIRQYNDVAYLKKIVGFLDSVSPSGSRVVAHLSGGEPMLMPNYNVLSGLLRASGHKIAVNTNLSVSIDNSKWVSANPPESYTAIVASLHWQSLNNFSRIYERVKFLKNNGYPIYVRMVGHPLFFEYLDDLDERFKALDVSFTVNALYSEGYPRGYTSCQRETLMRFMRVHYEAIRLHGGLDMRRRRCFAGSRLLCVDLSVAGGGRVYPCVSASQPENCIGTIHDGVKLFEGATPCLMKEKLCSCAVHFMNDIIPDVSEASRHEMMARGYIENIVDTWDSWKANKKIETRYHGSAPQGTRYGETHLLAPAMQGQGGRSYSVMVSLPALDSWWAHSAASCSVEGPTSFDINAHDLGNDYLFCSPEFVLPCGQYQLELKSVVRKGAFSFGVESCKRNCWILVKNAFRSGKHVLEFLIPPQGDRVRVVIAACSESLDKQVDIRILGLSMGRERLSMRLIAVHARRMLDDLKVLWRTRYLPGVLSRAVALLPTLHALCLWQDYRVVDVVEAGYAVRGVLDWHDGVGGEYLLSADVGDDTLSVVPVAQGRMGKRLCVRFTPSSAPMSLGKLSRSDGSEIPLVCLFNFDQTGELTAKSQILALESPLALARRGEVVREGHGATALLSRDGHWGFRGVHVWQRGTAFQLAAPDRDRGMLTLLRGTVGEDIRLGPPEQVQLPAGAEPIGINAVPSALSPDGMLYVLSCRNRDAVLGVHWDGKPGEVQQVSVGGLSRSSVAVGDLRGTGQQSVVIALWGGDPKELNLPGLGEVVVLDQGGDGLLREVARFPAGMHPTDVACGDLDGDGRDEIAVLHYGVGIGLPERTHLGDVRIYKHGDRGFECVRVLRLPNPRIAYIGDVAGDGVQRLVCSLFFERYLAMIECSRGQG